MICDQLINCLEHIRYVNFTDSDRLFFEDVGEHRRLPTSLNPEHVGLPTGLAISPLLLNVYLHRLDDGMHQWCRGENGAFLRFADDMILLAPSADKLAEGIDKILAELQVLDINKSNLNLRINPHKIEPASVARLVGDMLPDANKRAIRTACQWVKAASSSDLLTLEKEALTAEMRNPFVTSLVERMSELGTEDELDALPERAKDRINRLAEMVYLEPKSDAVPRSTQVLFAANQLVRGWLSEESADQDRRELRDIRIIIATALRTAPEKPLLWRAAIRAALRRPTAERSITEVQNDDDEAAKWFLTVAGHFGPDSDGRWHLEESPETVNPIWPMFTSYHRHEVWQTVATTARELHTARARLSAEVSSFPSSRSWLFRAANETHLENAPRWLESVALKLSEIWYGRIGKSQVPHPWELDSLALCALSFIPRRICASKWDAKLKRPWPAVVAHLLRVAEMSDWLKTARLLEDATASDHKYSATRSVCVLMGAVEANDEAEINKSLGASLKRKHFLRLAEAAALDTSTSDALLTAAESEMLQFLNLPVKDQTLIGRRDYSRSRRIYLNLGGRVL